MLKRFFDLEGHKTNVRTEVLAGITTFLTMAYILAVNPEILSKAGMDKDAVFTATALSAFIGTLVMALWAKLPFALAPGMGLNAFFAFTVVLTMGYSWQFALTAVFIEGILFLLLTAFNIRELIVDSIPLNMKHAVSAGIGLFIAFIGLQHAGLVVSSPATMLTLGDIKSPMALVAVVGILPIPWHTSSELLPPSLILQSTMLPSSSNASPHLSLSFASTHLSGVSFAST